jgi:L-alanine-DL-glutamate epimerase-like enolase superfamily enzyme
MKITAARAGHYRVPREVFWPLPIDSGVHDLATWEFLICEIDTDAGVTGTGFTYTVGYGGSAILAALNDEVIPHLIGRDVRDVDVLFNELHTRLHMIGTGVSSMAIAAADTAAWDALARESAMPLYRYLGAYRDEIQAYASGIDLAYTEDQLLEEMRGFRVAGFTAVKMKVGRPFPEDLRRLAAVREAIGPGCTLLVDALQGWSLGEAARRLRRMDEFDIAWLEEPLAPTDIDGHAALQANSLVPIAAGETLFTVSEFTEYIRRGAIRVAQPDVIRLGITGWLRVAKIAEAFGLPLAPHSIQEIHAHLLCAVPNALWLEYLPLFDPLTGQSIQVANGMARPSQGPGHGMTFSAEIMDPYRVG